LDQFFLEQCSVLRKYTDNLLVIVIGIIFESDPLKKELEIGVEKYITFESLDEYKEYVEIGLWNGKEEKEE